MNQERFNNFIQHLCETKNENYILNVAYYDLMEDIGKDLATAALILHMRGNLWRMTPWSDDWPSHDNFAAIRFLAKKYGIKIKIPLRQKIAKLWHPVNYMHFLGLPNIPAVMAVMPSKKIRPWFGKRWWMGLFWKHVDTIPNGGYTQLYYRSRSNKLDIIEESEHALDGALLNFLRFKTDYMPNTTEVCHIFAKSLFTYRYGEWMFWEYHRRQDDEVLVKLALETRPTYAHREV